MRIVKSIRLLVLFLLLDASVYGQGVTAFIERFPVVNYPLLLDTSLSHMVSTQKKFSHEEVFSVLLDQYKNGKTQAPVHLFNDLLAHPEHLLTYNEFAKLTVFTDSSYSMDLLPLGHIKNANGWDLYFIAVSYYSEGYSYMIFRAKEEKNALYDFKEIIYSWISLFPYFNYQYAKVSDTSMQILSYGADTSWCIHRNNNASDSVRVLMNQAVHDEKTLEALYFDQTFDGAKVYYVSSKNTKPVQLQVLEMKNLTYIVRFPGDKMLYTLKATKNTDYGYTITCTDSKGKEQVFTQAGPMIAKNEELGNLIAAFEGLTTYYNYHTFKIK